MDNEFYNAFASPITIAQNTLLENETGTTQKPPKLMDIDDYNGWSERFGNWVEAYHLDAWDHTEVQYFRPLGSDRKEIPIRELSHEEKKKYKDENLLKSHLKDQATKQDFLHFQHSIHLSLQQRNYTKEVAKSHMFLLVTVLESYGGLVAGRIGNPMLTKEDYDQIDAEEMELMNIKWCMASVLRQAEKFKQITGIDDFRDANVSNLGFDKSKVTCFRCREKRHFKRECTNREAGGAQNPFGNNDYYRKAIYHQVSQQPHQQQQAQTAHGRKEIEDSMRACLVNQGKDSEFGWDKYVPKDSKVCLAEQDDEKLPEGFSWNNFCLDKEFMEKELSNDKAFVANASD
ncbi:putative transcription factor interactor and regulator CCHC(Zn) family [Helianthus anomalus]